MPFEAPENGWISVAITAYGYNLSSHEWISLENGNGLPDYIGVGMKNVLMYFANAGATGGSTNFIPLKKGTKLSSFNTYGGGGTYSAMFYPCSK